MPATLSLVASFSNAAIDFSGFPVSSSLTRSTSMPSFLRSSSARVTPLLRFSPIGASGPVIELTKPIFTFVAPCASPDTRSEVAARKMMKRFIACSLSSVDEELHLKRELLLFPADFGFQVTNGALHVEAVAVGIPVDADQIPLLAARFLRRSKASIFVARPWPELRSLEEHAAVGDEDVASREGGHGADRRAERGRHVDVDVSGRTLVVALRVV